MKTSHRSLIILIDFGRVLHENFEEASAGPEREEDDCLDHTDILLDFDTVLQGAMTEGAVRRRDAALSFLQLLGELLL